MQYYDKLRDLELEIIRLDSVESLIRIAANSDSPSGADIQNLLWYLEGSMTNINESISEKFYDLWEQVRTESWLQNNKPTNSMFVSDELNSIVNSWASPKEN